MIDLSIAANISDRIAPLRDGRVRPEGLRLHFAASKHRDVFWRMLRYGDFDVAEMSMSSYAIALSQGLDDLIAIPIFTSRFFRHGCIYVNAESGIESPSDLRGHLVGVPEYQITAAVWMRGLLQDEYGLSPTDVQWATGGEERMPISWPHGVSVRRVQGQQRLLDMLEQGEVKAYLAAFTGSRITRGSDKVRPLFEKADQLEEEYYRRTGIFPIMHTVVMRKSLYDRHPWIARNLFDAFCEAKRICLDELEGPDALPYSMPFLLHYLEHQRQIFGRNPWPYGVDGNMPTLTTFLRYMQEQKLIAKKIAPEEMFAPNCLGEADPYDRAGGR